ncbi:hypothetical protein ABZ845_15485 [Streptomyces sp. NPDC047022]|uniref:hypothetical protein n=1 Tax=Streptomyces sp. NPDC047022 TaxID=3155737 RepID=UPI0033CD6317
MPKPSYDEPFTDEEGADRAPSPGLLQVHIGSNGSRVPVAVTGEFCLDDSQNLQHALR